MFEPRSSSRIRLLASPEIAGALEAALRREQVAVLRQPFGAEALLVLQLAIGRGLVQMIEAAGEAIAAVLRAQRGHVRIRTEDGDIPLANLTAEQIGALLATALPEG